MSPEKRDFSSFEFTGDMFSELEENVFIGSLSHRNNQEISKEHNVSVDEVVKARTSMRSGIERATGVLTRTTTDMLIELQKLGQIKYNPKQDKY